MTLPMVHPSIEIYQVSVFVLGAIKEYKKYYIN